MKKSKSLLTKGLLLLGGMGLFFASAASLTSCGFFETSSEGTLISTVTHSTDSDGNTVITFHFTDGTTSSVTVNAGEDGSDGISIEDVTGVLNSDNTYTLTITYSNGSTSTLTIPVVKGDDGEDGVSITGVTVGSTTHEDGTTYTTFQFTYSNGTTSEVFEIKNGVDGEDGVSVSISCTYVYDEDGNVTGYTLTVNSSDGTSSEFNVPIIYIISMSSATETVNGTTYYVITITYSNGSTSTLRLEAPTSTTWSYGSTDPNADDNPGTTGDYYVNTTSGQVWVMNSNGEWTFAFSFTSSTTTTNVRFNVNKTTYNEYFVDTVDNQEVASEDTSRTYTLNAGSLMATSSFPTVKRDGYTFAGWYTHRTDVNAGQFTSLTPVPTLTTTSYFDLYPRWTAE
ncbi:MAG: hypothetical protein Q4F15_05795 [Bacillota bacterium]|nr:hypothetical protein [Bacillota bacterium]